ncbi:MAG: hypothetical protein WKF36_06935 [Candidatus Nitrosocosmicus sp.]
MFSWNPLRVLFLYFDTDTTSSPGGLLWTGRLNASFSAKKNVWRWMPLQQKPKWHSLKIALFLCFEVDSRITGNGNEPLIGTQYNVPRCGGSFSLFLRSIC